MTRTCESPPWPLAGDERYEHAVNGAAAPPSWNS